MIANPDVALIEDAMLLRTKRLEIPSMTGLAFVGAGGLGWHARLSNSTAVRAACADD